ncbi:MAG TPA: hypothetical protein VGE72_27855 [Azospirillum sp.]
MKAYAFDPTGGRGPLNRVVLKVPCEPLQCGPIGCKIAVGYFPAAEGDSGGNLSGQTVFTCLSHDIIAHETTHAVLDRIRRYFSETTSPDTTAFHEALADIVALFQHFRLDAVVLDVIKRSGGLLHRPNLKARIVPDGRNSGGDAVMAGSARPL